MVERRAYVSRGGGSGKPLEPGYIALIVILCIVGALVGFCVRMRRKQKLQQMIADGINNQLNNNGTTDGARARNSGAARMRTRSPRARSPMPFLHVSQSGAVDYTDSAVEQAQYTGVADVRVQSTAASNSISHPAPSRDDLLAQDPLPSYAQLYGRNNASE